MTTTCPNGHLSATTDYCDQCGAKVGGSTEQAAPGPVAPTELLRAAPLDTVAAEPCPDCAEPRVADDRFCEGCGYSFVDGTSGQAAGPPPVATPEEWEALVTADREYFARVGPEGIVFPCESEGRRFALDGRDLRIGRGGSSAGGRPEIDITGAGEDPAVSRLHATIVRQDDGSYAVVDQGSTNGTSINDDPTSIAANVPVPLADGDRVHLGAWTTITLRRTGGTGSDAQ
ncbi:MAG: FHA domain-containing protein [Solirubrobacteraceae bacterium]